MSSVTTHVLDTSRGRPAAGIRVHLSREGTGGWADIGTGVTDADGRLRALCAPGTELVPGVYRITFETGAYFAAQGVEGFYPEVTIEFEIRDSKEHHHVPLLLSPYGYSTYRGS
jgi:5-hydroxyisourate hydrolase